MLLLPGGKTGESWVLGRYGTEEYFHVVASPYMCVLDKEALGEVFLLVPRSSTVSNISPLAPYVSSSTCCSCQGTNGRSLGTFQYWMFFRKSESTVQKATSICFISVWDCALYMLHATAVHPAELEDVSMVSDAYVCNFLGWKDLVLIFANMTQHSPSYL